MKNSETYPVSGVDHPERRPGEVYLTNSTVENFAHIGWQHKRLGRVAFSWLNPEADRVPEIDRMYPVFVEVAEMRQRLGRNPDIVMMPDCLECLEPDDPDPWRLGGYTENR